MLFDETVDLCQSVDIELPTLPRQRKLTLRFRGQATEHVWSNSTEYYRAQYFCLIDAAVGALERRYNQPGLRQYELMKSALLQQKTQSELQQIFASYSEIKADLLHAQLCMYDSQQKQQWKRETVIDVANTLSTIIDPAVRPLFDQIEALVRLLMTIPCRSRAKFLFTASLKDIPTELHESKQIKSYINSSHTQGLCGQVRSLCNS